MSLYGYFKIQKQKNRQARRDAAGRTRPDKQITNFKNYDYGKEDNRFR